MAGVPAPQVLSAAAIQTTAQVGVLAVLFSGSVLITLPRTQHSQLYVGAGLVVAVLLGAATVLLIWLSRNVDAARMWARHVVGRLPPFSRGFVEATLRSLVTGVEALRSDHRLLMRTTAWAGANWLLDAASLWVFVAAFGHRLNADELLVAYGLANLLGGLPITPGGLGVIEGFLIPALVGLGTPAASATLGVLAWRAASFWLPIPVGGLSYLSLRLGPWALPTKPEPGRRADRAPVRARAGARVRPRVRPRPGVSRLRSRIATEHAAQRRSSRTDDGLLPPARRCWTRAAAAPAARHTAQPRRTGTRSTRCPTWSWNASRSSPGRKRAGG